MKVVDTNVLIYAVNEDARHHESAKAWLHRGLTGSEPIGLAWVVLLGFVRIVTNPRILPTALAVGDAMGLVETWVSLASTLVVEPTARHTSVLRGLLEATGTAANLTTDAHIAALAIEHGATVATYDRDFQRYNVPVEIPTA